MKKASTRENIALRCFASNFARGPLFLPLLFDVSRSRLSAVWGQARRLTSEPFTFRFEKAPLGGMNSGVASRGFFALAHILRPTMHADKIFEKHKLRYAPCRGMHARALNLARTSTRILSGTAIRFGLVNVLQKLLSFFFFFPLIPCTCTHGINQA